MSVEMRCYHSFGTGRSGQAAGKYRQPPPGSGQSPAIGAQVVTVVVCVHPFGLGLYLPDHGMFGHMDAIFMDVATQPDRPFSMDEDYPAVGTEITARVAGWAGHQLRLVGRPIPSEQVPSATSADKSEE